MLSSYREELYSTENYPLLVLLVHALCTTVNMEKLINKYLRGNFMVPFKTKNRVSLAEQIFPHLRYL